MGADAEVSADRAPKEIWVYIVDGSGEKISDEVPAVLTFSHTDPEAGDQWTVVAARGYRALEGMEARKPAAMAVRFADGHVATGPVPPDSWDVIEEG